MGAAGVECSVFAASDHVFFCFVLLRKLMFVFVIVVSSCRNLICMICGSVHFTVLFYQVVCFSVRKLSLPCTFLRALLFLKVGLIYRFPEAKHGKFKNNKAVFFHVVLF